MKRISTSEMCFQYFAKFCGTEMAVPQIFLPEIVCIQSIIGEKGEKSRNKLGALLKTPNKRGTKLCRIKDRRQKNGKK